METRQIYIGFEYLGPWKKYYEDWGEALGGDEIDVYAADPDD